ncbi:MAG TPA: thioredoxin family protein [bacterium]|jgi:peroxiredoxin|nr:thioredoxin family protein [bacterium]
MNRILLSALFALALASSARASVAVGAPAPDFSLMSASGKTVQLSDYRGKLVVLEWVNSGCPFVHKQYDSDNMQRLQRKYTDEGVVWLTISSSCQGKEGYFAEPKDARAFIKERNAAMTALLLDHKGVVGREYGAKTTPDMVVLTKKGTVAYEGAIDDKPSTDLADIPGAHNYVAAALDALMDGRPVAVTQTRSYGCSIKYE